MTIKHKIMACSKNEGDRALFSQKSVILPKTKTITAAADPVAAGNFDAVMQSVRHNRADTQSAA